MFTKHLIICVFMFTSLVSAEALRGMGDSFITNFLPVGWSVSPEYAKAKMSECGFKSQYERSRINLDNYHNISVPSGALSYKSIKINVFGLGEISADLNISFWEDSLVNFSLSNIVPNKKSLYKYFKYKYGAPCESINVPGDAVLHSWRSGEYKAVVRVSGNKREELSCFIDFKEFVFFLEKNRLIKDRISFIYDQNRSFFDVDRWFEFNKTGSYLVYSNKDSAKDTTVYLEEPLIYKDSKSFFFIVRLHVVTGGSSEMRAYHYNLGKGPEDKINHNIRRVTLNRIDFKTDLVDHWVHRVFKPVPDLKFIEKTGSEYREWLYDYPADHYLRIVCTTVLDICSNRKQNYIKGELP